MTFTEAAALVLRLVGKPLHYKEITDVAIEKNLLSHVGKSPEVTMGARLAAAVKKGENDVPLIRIKPGVFALNEWDQATIDRGLADRTPAMDLIAAHGDAISAMEATVVASYPDEEEEDADGAAPEAGSEMLKMAATANEFFTAEDDDDQPIFAQPVAPIVVETLDGASDDEEGDGGGRRRRRRRRRGRDGDEVAAGGDDDLPSYTISDAPAAELEEVPEEGAVRAERPRERERGERERGERERGERERGERERGERERGDRERGDRDRAGRRERRETPELPALSEGAEQLAEVLGSYDRSQGPVGLSKVVEAGLRRGKLQGEVGALCASLGAAARVENLRRIEKGLRPRFRFVGTRVALTEWSFDGELARAEQELTKSWERYQELLRRTLQKRLAELPSRAASELLLAVLERQGIEGLAPVRRPGGGNGDLHFMGTQRTLGGAAPQAIVFRREGKEIGREQVQELRGTLHHYGAAVGGFLITTGQVLSGAREEAIAPGAAPVTLVDGAQLARLCEEAGIGVVRNALQVPLLDLELLEALRNGG